MILDRINLIFMNKYILYHSIIFFYFYNCFSKLFSTLFSTLNFKIKICEDTFSFFTFHEVNRKYLVSSLDTSACCWKIEVSSIRFQVSILRHFRYRKFSNLSTLFARGEKRRYVVYIYSTKSPEFRTHRKMNFIGFIPRKIFLIDEFHIARHKHPDSFSTHTLDVLMNARMR